MRLDTDFCVELVRMMLKESERNNTSIDTEREKICKLVDKAAEIAKGAKEAGI